MELEGLKRTMKRVKKQKLKPQAIITDRHLQVAKWIREILEPKGISHFFDVWHVAKGKNVPFVTM